MSSIINLNLNENNINIESNINSLSLEQLLDTQDILNILSNYKNNSLYYQ
jgi:hypothetical protein